MIVKNRLRMTREKVLDFFCEKRSSEDGLNLLVFSKIHYPYSVFPVIRPYKAVHVPSEGLTKQYTLR